MTFLLGILRRDATVSTNVHDTYFVVAYFYLTIVLAWLFMGMGLGYWIFHRLKKKLSHRLNVAHVLISAIGPLGIWLCVKFQDQIESKDYMDNFELNNTLGLIILLLLCLTIAGQLLYPINLTMAIFKSGKTGGQEQL